MAWSAADITTGDEIDHYDLDYPLCWSTHVIRAAKDNTGFGVVWVDGDEGGGTADYTDTDITDDASTPSYPTKRVYDDYAHLDSRVANASGTDMWLIAKAGTSDVFDAFDCVMIGGHNLGTLTTSACELWVSDTADVEASGTKIYDWGAVSTDKRLVSVNLDEGSNTNPRRISGATYVALRCTVASGEDPRVGEFWLGRRRQLWKDPRMGHNPDFSASNFADFVSQSGIVSRYTYHRDRRDLQIELLSGTSNNASVMTNLWADMQEGTKPLVYVPNPNSDPDTAYVLWNDGDTIFGGNHQASNVRTWSLNLREQAPFFDRE